VGLTLEDASVRLATTVLLQPVSLTIAAGEAVLLMGPSGSGKSSLLSFISGDLAPPLSATGRVLLDGKDVTGLPPERRRIGRLFQDDLLFPHLTVGENLLFGMARGPRESRTARMQAALADAGLEGFAGRNPATLSGGQRARVSLMRALLAEPAAMLLDEPFGALDEELRQSVRAFVYSHLAARRIPSLVVSHDRQDAPPGGRILAVTSKGLIRDA
jgi:putative thiamine transport system ATP-binding protein